MYIFYCVLCAICVLYFCSHAQLFVTLWTVDHQAPLSMDSLGTNTGVGCHFLLQGYLPDPVTELTSLTSPALAGRFSTTSTT